MRTGLHFDAEELLGRDADLARLRASVRTSRLTSIIGPGGIGKTRIAHVLAREASQTRVHFVELVGIASSDDVVAEVGAALGVRDSVTSRRTHTPAQLADIRGRIAQELDTAPTLLVLDNCEHVVEAVASLVAFLLVPSRDLRVVTTSRAPLNIAAEQVVLLDQLAPDDAAACSTTGAAARPTPSSTRMVADVVARLDGLPLAIELAAARVRTMSLEELRTRLDDRFTLLRGGDRSAPARHQTLTAVIAWSWDLLTPPRATGAGLALDLPRRVRFGHAGAVLGTDAIDLVEALVDQSLLSVVEAEGAARYRMLETVREFAAASAGRRPVSLAAALAAQDRVGDLAWSTGARRSSGPTSSRAGRAEPGGEQPRRRASPGAHRRRRRVAVRLFATLGIFWTITGNHPRVFAHRRLPRSGSSSRWDPPRSWYLRPRRCLACSDPRRLLPGPVPRDADLRPCDGSVRPSAPWARRRTRCSWRRSREDEPVESRSRAGPPARIRSAMMGLQWAARLPRTRVTSLKLPRPTPGARSRSPTSRRRPGSGRLETQLACSRCSRRPIRRRSTRMSLAAARRLHADDDAALRACGMAYGGPDPRGHGRVRADPGRDRRHADGKRSVGSWSSPRSGGAGAGPGRCDGGCASSTPGPRGAAHPFPGMEASGLRAVDARGRSAGRGRCRMPRRWP